MDPRIHLAIDNCFAVKRWTTPAEWSRVIRDMGLKCVECVTDVDCEPLLMDEGYLADWCEEVAALQESGSISVVMMYTGNSTYDTTGLAHYDERVRDRIINVWFDRLMRMAARLNAPVGYYVSALPESALMDRRRYAEAMDALRESMINLNKMAAKLNVKYLAVEQMYTPGQPPFTIEGTAALMKHVCAQSGKALYFTEDVGHHCPFYTLPSANRVKDAYERYLKDGYVEIWLGPREAYELFTDVSRNGESLNDDTANEIVRLCGENGRLFSAERDGSCYEWLKALGCYSPIIHLQQTDGSFSAHRPFTDANNREGIIEPQKLLKSLAQSYERPDEAYLPPKCEDIYLTLELYGSTRDIGYQLLYDIEKSVEYWRKSVPRDGMRLSELIR